VVVAQSSSPSPSPFSSRPLDAAAAKTNTWAQQPPWESEAARPRSAKELVEAVIEQEGLQAPRVAAAMRQGSQAAVQFGRLFGSHTC